MTREEITNLGLEELETRAAAIATETAEADKEQLEALNAELDAIEERKAVIIAENEARKKAAEAVAEGKGEIIEERKEVHKMTDIEIRNGHEYVEAFAKYVKTGNAAECRALLSDNVQNGVIPVPAFVGEIVAKRLEESQILRRLRRMEAPGNVKVGFEINAPAATAHTEGGGEIDPEALALGIVTIEAYLSYIYDEVARGIIKAEENAVVAAILAAPQTATATAPAVAKTGSAAGAITDFVDARALLSSAAEDLVIICTPADYATYRGLQMSASYGVDPFDGLEVLFSDAATVPIIGDLGGVMINLPKGEAVEFKYDDKTLMTSDLVNILGRQPAGIAVVGNLFFAKVAA